MYQGCQPEQDRAELFNLLSDCFHNIDITATIISDKFTMWPPPCRELSILPSGQSSRPSRLETDIQGDRRHRLRVKTKNKEKT